MKKPLVVVELKDKRDLYILEALKDDGFDVLIFGDRIDSELAVFCLSLTSNPTLDLLKTIPKGSILFAREFNESLKTVALDKNITLFSYFDNEDFIVKNAYLTAEAALGLIIENTDESIVNIEALVIGYGRVGKAISKVLKDNNAKVTVTNRNEKTLSEALILADEIVRFDEFKNGLEKYLVIINTVPKMVLEEESLRKINKNAFILDLASKPGGVDFEASKKQNLKCLHALGLPGKVKAKAAGYYVKEIILDSLRGVYER